ncbi:MAG: cation transporter [Clostridia bacterium]|nr:cation transporter [Clostridia bacterium]
MTNFLIKLFIKNQNDTTDPNVRTAYANLSGFTGIVVNLILFIMKLIVGILSASVAIIADAFNNISDAGSSVVAMIGFRLSSKHVDKEHPLGHGRMEYVTGFIVDMLIILVGFELLTGSLEKIFNPTMPHANTLTYVLLGVAILVKFWLYFFYKKIGKIISSSSIRAAATDSLSDCAATTLVLLSAIVATVFDVAIDGWAGLIVAGLILYAGARAAKETIDLLLGTPPTAEYIQRIYDFVKNYPEIVGIHDVVVHDYGPARQIMSFHAEIPSDYDVNLAHEIIDKVERDMREEFGAIVTIHLDPIAVNDEEVNAMRKFAIECMNEVDETFTLHDFRMTKGEKYTNLIFDLVIPVDCKLDDEEAAKRVATKIKERNENCFAVIKAEHPFV